MNLTSFFFPSYDCWGAIQMSTRLANEFVQRLLLEWIETGAVDNFMAKLVVFHASDHIRCYKEVKFSELSDLDVSAVLLAGLRGLLVTRDSGANMLSAMNAMRIHDSFPCGL